jgi:hypothetical protein
VVIKKNSTEQHKVSCCRELGRVLKMTVEGDWEEMVRNELGCEKKSPCVV